MESIYIIRALCICMLSSFSHVQLFATLWTVPHQAPLSMGFSRQEYWSAIPSSKESSQLRNWAHISYISCIGRQFLYHQHQLGGPLGYWETHKDLSKCKTRNYKTPRGEHRQNTFRHKSQEDPLWPISHIIGNKSKNKQIDLIKMFLLFNMLSRLVITLFQGASIF